MYVIIKILIKCLTYKQMILKSRDVINYYSKGATKS
jgi:hypothetical protein